MKKVLIITNNPRVAVLPGAEFHQETLFEILTRVRNMVHNGYILISHPLAGSVKPNETPYKSIAITKENYLDMMSLELIENAIAVYNRLQKDLKTPYWTDQILDDFMVIDLDLIKHALI